MQRRCVVRPVAVSGFQSSPVPEDGCNGGSIVTWTANDAGFNPHPSRRTGATMGCNTFFAPHCMFQSSPVPEDGCNARGDSKNVNDSRVSILTRPGGRVQPNTMVPYVHRAKVSILTRPGGRVQRVQARGSRSAGFTFQSSPVPEDGCNKTQRGMQLVANRVSILTRPGGRVQPAGLRCNRHIIHVSILTRPGGRVQRLRRG